MPLADEYWETHAYVMLGLECDDCGVQLDCEHCWDGVASGEAGAQQFAERSVELARRTGWSLEYDPETPNFYCPQCTANRKENA